MSVLNQLGFNRTKEEFKGSGYGSYKFTYQNIVESDKYGNLPCASSICYSHEVTVILAGMKYTISVETFQEGDEDGY